VIYELENVFDKTPKKCVFNDEQTCFIGTTFFNSLYVDIDRDYELDIDDEEEVSNITNIVYANKVFYMMCNKRFGLLGQYLLALNTDDPD
jgi:hypothetical protein